MPAKIPLRPSYILLFFCIAVFSVFLFGIAPNLHNTVTIAGKPEEVQLRNEARKSEQQESMKEKKQLQNSPLPSTTPTPTVTPSVEPLPEETSAEKAWEIQSVSSMKETKDRLCGQPAQEYIDKWVSRAKELGVNYISISTPYDSPACADAVEYTRRWVAAIRKQNLNVWHRHMPNAFEGIYDVPKNNGDDYLQVIGSYIKNYPDLFAEGDIFTPIPEPQNGGIQGVTYCAGGVCQFSSAADFNQWLRDAMAVSKNAFAEIGLNGLDKIGYFGFDGFVAWGHNNPDWNGILEESTVSMMKNITIDHYPEVVGDTMENSLNELEQRYPNTPVIIGEWGVIEGNNYDEQINAAMKAAKRPSVIGFNYWHMGAGGNESLVDANLNPLPQYFAVQSNFYTD